MGFDGDDPIPASFVIYDTRTDEAATYRLPAVPFA